MKYKAALSMRMYVYTVRGAGSCACVHHLTVTRSIVPSAAPNSTTRLDNDGDLPVAQAEEESAAGGGDGVYRLGPMARRTLSRSRSMSAPSEVSVETLKVAVSPLCSGACALGVAETLCAMPSRLTSMSSAETGAETGPRRGIAMRAGVGCHAGAERGKLHEKVLPERC